MAVPVAGHAQSTAPADFDGAVRGCEAWVLDPASRAKGPGPFIAALRLDKRMGLVRAVSEASLPPPALRQANRYFRINTSPSAGFVLVTSDRLPMCHITAGGDVDMQPVAETVLASKGFQARWKLVSTEIQGEMRSTHFRSSRDRAFSMIISRAARPGGRQNRVQLFATAIYETKR